MKAFCSRVLSSLFPSNTNFSQEYPALTSWLQSNQFLHGKGSDYHRFAVTFTRNKQINDVLQLFASVEGADVESLRKHRMVGYLVVTASDAMAI